MFTLHKLLSLTSFLFLVFSGCAPIDPSDALKQAMQYAPVTEDKYESPPHPLRVRFDPMVMAAPWSGHLPKSYFEFTPSATFDESVKQSGGGYRWEGPPAENPDWRGLKLDTVYFLAYQVVVIGVLYIAPEKLSGWSQEDKDNYSLERWKENVTNPIWDDDEWWVNYILHPYWGATYYIRARERGLERTQSFWYSVLLSTLYEYGAEALFEPVSFQDLIVTPVAGSLLGEFVFTRIRERFRAKSGELEWSDKAVLFITDPLGVVNETVSLILGVNTEVNFCRLRMENIPRSSGVSGETENTMQAHARIKSV
jgi:hypothetical protein